MSNSLIHTIFLAAGFLLLFASGEFLYHVLKVKAELTRKYVHFSTGFITMLFPPLIGNHWLVMALCGSFLLILAISMRFDLLKSINAVDRKTHGSILYPIVVYGCYLAYDYSEHFSYFYIPVLILAVSDPVAALVGKGYPIGKYTIFGHSKTLSGSLGFLVSAVILCISLFIFVDERSFGFALVAALVIAFCTTILEAVSHKGYDNFTIPGSALGVLFIIENLI